ncbi:hypothetical protein [Pseudomonas lundensis]|uniref:hypothetical protein n=1 Tax=Pseudomonas lundensis TaxID=86185 RepID=UPI0014747D0F|nr:hypothetical protein [Pseudomonas lundensis]NNA05028.1 hypothetical protein [Pseudomonas lundensis]
MKGIGLQDKVILTSMKNMENYRVRHEGTASLKLTGNEFVPLNTIPVVSVGKATYSQRESSWVVPWFYTLEDPNAYVPFI